MNYKKKTILVVDLKGKKVLMRCAATSMCPQMMPV